MNKDTINYYDTNAEKFVSGTRDVDFSYTQELFVSYLKEGAKILDFGCGSGRDTLYFLNKGFDVEAIDGSEEMCKVAHEYTGINIKHMYFEDLDKENYYDAIWACSSILHCDHNSLQIVINKISKALKKDGIAYVSFKYSNFEGFRNGRYFIDLTEESVTPYIKDFEIEKEWISEDVRPGRENEKWLNIIMRTKNK